MTIQIEISINEKSYALKSLEELDLLIAETFEKHDFNEIWISGHGTSCLLLLTNKSNTFAMYLRHEGDSGFGSRSKIFQENSEEFEKFKLSNGQIDEYPLNWLISREDGKNSLLEYYKSGNKHERIKWNEE